MLATCRFALLLKVYSETGRSSVETLAGDTLFELFGAVFLFIWCGNGVPKPLFLALHSWSGANISHSTVSRRLNLRFGLESCKLVQKPPLNPLLIKGVSAMSKFSVISAMSKFSVTGHQRTGARCCFLTNLQCNSFVFTCNMFGNLAENGSTRHTLFIQLHTPWFRWFGGLRQLLVLP